MHHAPFGRKIGNTPYEQYSVLGIKYGYDTNTSSRSFGLERDGLTPAVVARGAALGEPGEGHLLGREGDGQALAVIVRTGSWTMSALH